jgi:methionyl aminopeptidase
MGVLTKDEQSKMRASGRMSAKAMKKVLSSVKEGITLKELDLIAEEEIKSLGGQSSFKKEPGYRWTSCITVNNEVVHGIPRDVVLKKGDKVSIDLGAIYQGIHSDTSWSVIVGDHPTKFLKIGEEAMWRGIKKALAGGRVGDISEEIQETIEGAGYKVVHALVGHGIGRSLHEDPEIPGLGVSGTGPVLREGEAIAIEAIYTEGTREVRVAEDGWTVLSADGSLGGLFEMTVIVGKKKAEVVTDWRKV